MKRPLTLLGVATALSAAPAAALPPDGRPLEGNDYTIDLFQGPVLSATRVIGIAGAFAALAENVEGNAVNPAAPAARVPYSFSHFDYDLGFGITFPSAIDDTDFWNSGRPTELPKSESLDFLFLNLAVDLQFGRWGFGLTADLQRYALLRANEPDVQRDRLNAEIAVGHGQVARSFRDGQLLLGIGARTLNFSVTNTNDPTADNRELVSSSGVGFEAGVLWRPTDWPIRAGAAFHSAVTAQARDDGSPRVLYADDPENLLYLPERVTLPWDVNFGFAAQLGRRPFNPRWRDPARIIADYQRFMDWKARERERTRRSIERLKLTEDERRAWRAKLEAQEREDEGQLRRVRERILTELRWAYRALPRSYVLVTTQLTITGAARDAIGIEGMLGRTVQRSGETISVAPHLGIETELLPNWLRVRGGAYLEPNRFRSNPFGPRLHLTFGLDEKLFPWDVFGTFPSETEWRISGSIDAARSYFGWSLALGVWR